MHRVSRLLGRIVGWLFFGLLLAVILMVYSSLFLPQTNPSVVFPGQSSENIAEPLGTLPPMTPFPTRTGPMERVDPNLPIQPLATPAPNDPFQLTIHADSFPNTSLSTQEADLIVVGVVKEILPALWSTADGNRPENPWVEYSQETIYTPVVVEVEQYIKGADSFSLTLFAWGGAVGRDSVTWASDNLHTFHLGERVLLFLNKTDTSLLNGNLLWNPIEHYTLTVEGEAINSYQQVPMSQLMEEIQNNLGANESRFEAISMISS